MAKQSLLTMSVDALLKLRDDIADVLSEKADGLRRQLQALGGEKQGGRPAGKKAAGKGPSKLIGKKVEAKYRDPATGATWSGRGAPAGWLAAYEKQGGRREEFLIPLGAKNAPAKKAAMRK